MTDENVPDEFLKVIKDFVSDLRNTFPEFDSLINKWWKKDDEFDYIDNLDERKQAIERAHIISSKIVFEFCKKKMPPRFFDILYQNEDMFQESSTLDTEFLPHIYFKNLWQFDISQTTKDTIWKYLQLIMFSIVGSLDNKDVFGETAKMFEAINQDEFKDKLQDTLSKIQDLFSANTESNLGGNLNTEDMPNVDDIQSHIAGMLDGKLGRLAKEIAEETASNINLDINEGSDVKDILSGLIKNPTKLMGLVKTVSDKLDSKMKSGEIKESELISEATDLMNKMKNMEGMGDIQSMLRKMGMNGKVNKGAMESHLNRNLKLAQTKERMKAKVEANKIAKEEDKINQERKVNIPPKYSEQELVDIFSGESEKSNNKPNKKKKKKQK